MKKIKSHEISIKEYDGKIGNHSILQNCNIPGLFPTVKEPFLCEFVSFKDPVSKTAFPGEVQQVEPVFLSFLGCRQKC